MTDRQLLELAAKAAAGESPLLESIYAVATAHTEAVARIVGDTSDALDWWKYECGFGENPMKAGRFIGDSASTPKANKMRLISNLKQLAGLICEP